MEDAAFIKPCITQTWCQVWILSTQSSCPARLGTFLVDFPQIFAVPCHTRLSQGSAMTCCHLLGAAEGKRDTFQHKDSHRQISFLCLILLLINTLDKCGCALMSSLPPGWSWRREFPSKGNIWAGFVLGDHQIQQILTWILLFRILNKTLWCSPAACGWGKHLRSSPWGCPQA